MLCCCNDQVLPTAWHSFANRMARRFARSKTDVFVLKDNIIVMKQEKIRLLFVCLGNICRSPSAEAVIKKLVKDAGLQEQIEIDSAGIMGYHEGERADERMRAHAARRGYVLDSISRPVRTTDFYDFDLIIGMDDRNVDDLKHKAPDLESVAKIHQMTEYSRNKLYDYVPDPYYGGATGFELVLDLLEDACGGLLDTIASGPDS